jgi:hypothetical protein
MKKDLKTFEIVLPKIMYSNVVSLTEKNICKRERNPLLKLVDIKKNSYEKSLFKKTINYKEEFGSKKIVIIKPKMNSIVTINTIKGDSNEKEKENVEAKKIDTLNNNKVNFLNNVRSRKETEKVTTNSDRRIFLFKKTIENTLELDFKYYYKNKSIDLIMKKKCTYNQLFKN